MITLTIIATATGFASGRYNVKALISDSIGEPEAFATVRVYQSTDTTKIAAMGVTKDNGTIDLPLDAAGSYKLKVFSIGRAELSRQFNVNNNNPTADLGNLIVRSDDKMLGEVTVTAARPIVTKEIDRIGYDVQADEESKTNTLDEMLRKVPLVSVDADGTIKVKGSADFKIYKNGRPNNSFTKNAKEIFKAIPASMIKKIEVITDPGAREDAEGVGAILNIVTLENTIMKGMMGNLSLNYSTVSDYPAPNFWGSGQIDKVNISLYAGMSRISERQSRNKSRSEGTYDDSGNIQRSESEGSNKGSVSWFGLDGSYELDSLNLFTAEFGGYYYDITPISAGTESRYAPDGSMIYSFSTSTRQNPYRYFDINGNFNYQHSTKRPGETLTASYMVSTTNQTNNSSQRYSDMINMPVPYTGIDSDFKLDFIEHTLQFDWCRPFADIHTIDLGAKYIYRDNHSRTQQNYIGFHEEPLLDFSHHTHVAAAYADYRVRLGRLSLRGGLRYEFSRLSASYADNNNESFASNLSDWVPNAAIAYNINDANTIKLSYGTRINRPGISYLNPAVNQSPTSTSGGNPDLGSARNSSLSLNYNLISRKVNIDFTAGYSFTNNDIIAVQHIENDHLYQGYANAGHNKSFNTGLFLQWTAGKKTTVMLNGNATYNHYDNPSLNITNNGWGGNAYLRLSQRLPWNIMGNLFGAIWTGSINGLYGESRPQGISKLNYGLSLQRSFLKEDRLTLRLSTWNPFYPNQTRYKSTTTNLAYNSTSYTYQRQYFNLQIAVSYRFGSINAQVKKTATKIENDDLTGRKI